MTIFCFSDLEGAGDYTSAVAGTEGIAQFSAAIARELRERVRRLLRDLSSGEAGENKENLEPEREQGE